MDNTNKGHINKGMKIPQRSFNGNKTPFQLLELYQEGVKDVGSEWRNAILAFIRHRTGGEIIAIVAIWMLSRIAIALKDNLAGCLIVTSMIFLIGLLATFRVTKGINAKVTKEIQSQTSEPEIGDGCKKENGTDTG